LGLIAISVQPPTPPAGSNGFFDDIWGNIVSCITLHIGCRDLGAGGGNDGGGGNGGGGGGTAANTRDCAGKMLTVNHNLIVSSDATGAINGVGLRLTEHDTVDGGNPGMNYEVLANTWANITLDRGGSVTVAFSRHIGIESGLAGAFVNSATFGPSSHSNGAFTEVKGAVGIVGFPMGRWTTPSNTLRDVFNKNSQLTNMFATLRTMMTVLNNVFDCTSFAGH